MNKKALLISDFDSNKLNIELSLKVDGNKLLPITYDKHRESCYIQLPISKHSIDLIKHQYYDELLLILDESNIKEIYNFIEELDKKIIEIIDNKKSSLFEGYSKIKYKNIIKMNNEFKYIKLKLNKNTIYRKRLNITDINNLGKFSTTVIDKNMFTTGSLFRCIIQLSSIWISGNIFGLYIRPVIIEVLDLESIDFKDNDTNINNEEILSSFNNSDNSDDNISSEFIENFNNDL